MPNYRVEVDGIEELKELEGSWQDADYVAILQQLDVSGAAEIPAADLREMCLFALQDLDPPQAAALLLNYKLGTVLNAGQIRNYSIESQHERLWEQSADLKIHQPMFSVASLLNAASPMVFPTPDALRVTLRIASDDAAALAMFQDSMDRALLVRMLSCGMESSAILNRLFGDQIAVGNVADGDSIIWGVHVDGQDGNTVRLTIISSAYWLNAIRETESFEWKFVPEAK
jgi:hypothetical protein